MKEIKLTKKEIEYFDKLNSCSVACKKIIQEVVKHFEANVIAENIYWRELAKKYSLNVNEYEYNYDYFKKSITKGQSIKHKNICDLAKKNELYKAITDEIKNIVKDIKIEKQEKM